MKISEIDGMLPLPEELLLLVERKIWPSIGGVRNSTILGLINWTEFHKLVPDESDLLLSPPPFKTVADEIRLGAFYWTMPEVVIHQIDPEKTVVIGNFGHGSDTALALDYRNNENNPALIKLRWVDVDPKKNNSWVRVSQSFGEFCRAIGLL